MIFLNIRIVLQGDLRCAAPVYMVPFTCTAMGKDASEATSRNDATQPFQALMPEAKPSCI